MTRWFITGISSGIGEALARVALDRGDTVIGIARDAAALDAFEALSGQAIPVALDIARHEDVPAAVEAAFAHGPVDVVVNNAGRSVFGAFEETSVAEAKALFDVNVFGTWAVTQAALPRLRAQGHGTIVNLSSGCGINGMAGLSAYCASKFAIEGFTEALAQEVAAFGLKVMLVEPGAIATRFISHGTQDAGTRLPEYAFLSASGKTVLDAYYESAASPPESVADAILAAIDSGAPPLRLVVGADMKAGVTAKAEQLAALAATIS